MQAHALVAVLERFQRTGEIAPWEDNDHPIPADADTVDPSWTARTSSFIPNVLFIGENQLCALVHRHHVPRLIEALLAFAGGCREK